MAEKMCRCYITNGSLLTIAALFWAIGSLICGAVAVLTALRPAPPDALDVVGGWAPCGGCEDITRWSYLRWAALAGGVVLGLLQGWLLMWRVLASREVARIAALREPQAHQFFPPWRLLGLAILCPSCVQLQLHTQQFVVSALVFVALLANVSVSLALCAPKPPAPPTSPTHPTPHPTPSLRRFTNAPTPTHLLPHL